MTSQFGESHVEAAALSWLDGLGYSLLYGPDISPDGKAPERASYAEVIFSGRLHFALAHNNLRLSFTGYDDVISTVWR